MKLNFFKYTHYGKGLKYFGIFSEEKGNISSRHELEVRPLGYYILEDNFNRQTNENDNYG